MTNYEKHASESFQHLASSSGERGKTDNNKKKKAAKKRTDEKEATKLNQRKFKKQRSRHKDGDGWDMYVELPQTHYPRQPCARWQMKGVGQDAQRKCVDGQWKGE